jgi:hypothetical protein
MACVWPKEDEEDGPVSVVVLDAPVGIATEVVFPRTASRIVSLKFNG